MSVDLRLGDWRDVLGDVECDALITDPPYSDRVAKGFLSIGENGEKLREGIEYGGITEEWARSFVDAWAPRTARWFCVWSCHIGQRWWSEALSDAGWYVFAPVVWVKTDATPRFAGDGPASATEYLTAAERMPVDYLTVARTRRNERGGSRPGYYEGGMQRDHLRVGGKPLWLMRAIVRDYSRPGDVICDPCAGGATTLLAAAMEGRRAVGAEMDPQTYAKAQARLAKGYTAPLFVDERPPAKQEPLALDADPEAP